MSWRSRFEPCRAIRRRPGKLPEHSAQYDLSFTLTNALDQAIRRAVGVMPPGLTTRPVRLALLGSATMSHLVSAIRVAGVRRGLWIDIYENEFGHTLQELSDPRSPLHDFQPSAILLALDAYHLSAACTASLDAQGSEAALAEATDRIRHVWRLARDAFNCPIIHQTALPAYPPLLGSNEHRLPGSQAAFTARLNAALRPIADEAGVHLLALDDRASRDGLAAWHNPTYWHHAKQEIAPAAAPPYGELVAGCSAPSRDAPPSAWCSISTTRCGAASSATTGSMASCSARAARPAKPIVAFQDYAASYPAAGSSSPCAPRTTRPMPSSRSSRIQRCCSGEPISPASSPTGPTRRRISAQSPKS